jgi:hypothetical protein
MSVDFGIDYFNRNHPLTNLQIKSSLRVRRSIYEWFASQIGTVRGKAFLEHGSTPDITRADSNCFIRWLLEDGAIVYATSPEDILHLEQLFPGLKTIPWPPVKSTTKNFNYVISSAVIEHVGSHESQVEYLNTLLEISPGILLTTPNRNHWMEFHTKLPLLHWLPRKYHRFLLSKLHMEFWSKEENLHLLSRGDLVNLIELSCRETKLELQEDWYKPRLMGIVSNLVVLLRAHGVKETRVSSITSIPPQP